MTFSNYARLSIHTPGIVQHLVLGRTFTPASSMGLATGQKCACLGIHLSPTVSTVKSAHVKVTFTGMLRIVSLPTKVVVDICLNVSDFCSAVLSLDITSVSQRL